MWVTAPIVIWISQQKSPDVITEFGSNHQVGLGQIGQIPKYCRLVKSERHQLIR
jgi:hypothetical protein